MTLEITIITELPGLWEEQLPLLPWSGGSKKAPVPWHKLRARKKNKSSASSETRDRIKLFISAWRERIFWKLNLGHPIPQSDKPLTSVLRSALSRLLVGMPSPTAMALHSGPGERGKLQIVGGSLLSSLHSITLQCQDQKILFSGHLGGSDG